MGTVAIIVVAIVILGIIVSTRGGGGIGQVLKVVSDAPPEAGDECRSDVVPRNPRGLCPVRKVVLDAS